MADYNTIMRERQRAVRREMDRRGISLKAVALDCGVPYPTIRSYFPGERNAVPAVMPTSVLYAMAEAEALPLELLSLLMPDGVQLVRVPEDIDHDELSRACRAYVDLKGEAHHPASEDGREIGAGENVQLLRAAANVRAAAA